MRKAFHKSSLNLKKPRFNDCVILRKLHTSTFAYVSEDIDNYYSRTLGNMLHECPQLDVHILVMYINENKIKCPSVSRIKKILRLRFRSEF